MIRFPLGAAAGVLVFLAFPVVWLLAQTLPGAEMSAFTVAAAVVVPVAAPVFPLLALLAGAWLSGGGGR